MEPLMLTSAVCVRKLLSRTFSMSLACSRFRSSICMHAVTIEGTAMPRERLGAVDSHLACFSSSCLESCAIVLSLDQL